MNGLCSKLDSVSAAVTTYGISAFAVQESKLCAKVPSSELAIPGYVLFCRDRSANGGGVALFAN